MGFIQKLFNFDFEVALRNTLLDTDLFENKPLLCNCFFHFSANIRKKMEKLKISL